MLKIGRRAWAWLRWRIGLRVADPRLEAGSEQAFTDYYASRITDCRFLSDPAHYEHPRYRWILDTVHGGTLLEIGCGNGGMTAGLSTQVDRIVALDVSAPSLDALRDLQLPNVSAVQGLVEHYVPAESFDWIILSEVIEHLRNPGEVLRRCAAWLKPGGAILITVPHGHWESTEHLGEFTASALAELLAGVHGELIQIAYLRDRDNRRRWLTGVLRAPTTAAAEDHFFEASATRELRRRARS